MVAYLSKVSSISQFLLLPTVMKKGIEQIIQVMKIDGRKGRSITAAVTPGMLELSVTKHLMYTWIMPPGSVMILQDQWETPRNLS